MGKINEYNSKLTREERKEHASKAGKASRAKRKEKAELKIYMQALLDGSVKSSDGSTKTGAEAMAIVAFKEALQGDWKAWELVRDTAGQKPVEKVRVSDIDPDIAKEIEKMLNDE